ncbi:MAG: transcription-repair coupling factor [Oscillospiraceae bacterium]
MRQFANLLKQLPQYQEMTADIQKNNTPVLMSGLSPIHKAEFVYSFVENEGKNAVVIVPDEQTSVKLTADINAFFGEEIALIYTTRDFIYRDVEGVSREFEHQRLKVLDALSKDKAKIVIASIEAALQYTLPPKKLKENTFEIKTGGVYKIDELVETLVSAGYQNCNQVDGICQFSRRGGILDLFPPHADDPYRIEFWDDEVDSIAPFKIDTQRREGICDSLYITPAREVLFDSKEAMVEVLQEQSKLLSQKIQEKARANINTDIARLESGLMLGNIDRYLPLIYKKPATLFDYLGEEVLFISDPISIKETLRASDIQQNEDIKTMLEEGIIFKGCDTYNCDYVYFLSKVEQYPTVILETFERASYEIIIKKNHEVNALPLSPWGGEYDVLRDELCELIDHKYCCIVMAGTDRGAAALASDLIRDNVPTVLVEDVPKIVQGQVYIVASSLPSGFEYPDIKLTVKTHAKINSPSAKHKKKIENGSKLKSLSDLTVGDLVVHSAHGIGVFEGIVKREIQGIIKDYIKIRYAGTDMLFVPVTQLDLVAKYIGAKEDSGVKLNKLNSVDWSNTRKRVKLAVKDMAKELIELYSKRLKTKGYMFSEDTDWQRDFEQRFPYEETGDQLRCIEEIKEDMEKTSPMDRLLCGDVGFGKTEVAIRAAFKCVMDSKQCAVLVPTTILAWQHYKTFRARMEGYPIKIEILSRFRTPKQQEQIIKEIKRGEVDIVIGTHRIIQKDVEFRDLGLCVIDEEQRFGVAHKEKFKEMRNSVDVLTLSATPIPRTLNMAMSGIRDMSVIEEAPQDRHPVQTYVIEHDWGIIEQALRKELRRGGQVFYLHNRVESIDSCAFKLGQLVPEARIAVAHGKMTEEQLSKIWQQLVDHEIDVLVCTTIIETGVDVSNCNTLIIEDADRMGLSQLYQLRGRVGRGARRAYAFLTFKRGKALTDIATKRLSAIKEFTSFGSGFRIAMRDLEIRGAGSILGGKQHGHMEAVGYDMYLKLLSEAISEEKGETNINKADECMIDISIEAHIPEKYIENLTQRIDIYKKIAAVRSNEDAMDILDELIDRFGDPPQSVKGLVDVSLIRNAAATLGFKEISQRDDRILLFPEELNVEVASGLAARLKGRILVNAGAKPYIAIKLQKGQKPLEAIREVLEVIKCN